MATPTMFVAVNSDGSDLKIYSGPTAEPLPKSPANREWLEEYRAVAAGYWRETPYSPEPWGIVADPSAPPPAAVLIKKALRRHLVQSNEFLQTSPEVAGITLANMNAATMRQERALNLMLRAMLEIFDTDPPAYVVPEPERNATQQGAAK